MCIECGRIDKLKKKSLNYKDLETNMGKFYSSADLYMEQLKTHDVSLYEKFIRKIFKYIKKGSKILEVGCGVGQVSNFLVEKEYDVTGVDISSLFINEAKKHGKAKFYAGDSTKLPFKDKSFDAVISAETLEHIPNPRKALYEMSRVLRKGGIMIHRFPNKQNLIKNLFVKITGQTKFIIINPNLNNNVKGDDEDLCYLASTSEVICFLRKIKFQILYSKPFFWCSALIVARKRE